MFKQGLSEILNSLSVIFFSVPGCLNNVAAYIRIQFPIELNFLKAALKLLLNMVPAQADSLFSKAFHKPQSMKKFSFCTRAGKMELSS